MNITKSAPLPERPCEQLTCCEKNGSVQGNYINRVKKRHYCRITGKEKATRYGGPSTLIARYPQRISADYYAVITSGWQCDQCAGLLVGCQPLGSTRELILDFIAERTINHVCSACSNSAVYNSNFLSIPYTAIKSIASFSFSGSLRLGGVKTPLIFRVIRAFLCLHKIPFSPAAQLHFIIKGPVSLDTVTIYTSIPELLVAKNSYFISCYLKRNCFYPFGSMPRRFSSALANSLNQLPRVRPSEVAASFTCWRSSLLILIWKVGDHPSPRGDLSRFNVDMYVRNSYYHCCYVRTISVGTVKSKAPQVSLALAGLLTTNDSKIIEAAMRNHTIHPQGRDSYNLNKYIWRFIALSTAQPRVIHIVATSEQEARQQSPAGCVMIFAARIRQGVSHVQ